MISTRIFELRDEPDRYPGFIQTFKDDTVDAEAWKEVIAARCIALGAKPFGDDYIPVPLEFDNEGKRKKNVVGDICLSMQPFIIFSEKARQALDGFLSRVGEFLEVAAPVTGFVGYRVLKRIDDCINLELSKYTQYDNGAILIRKPTMYESKVADADIFFAPEAPSSVFISQAFKDAVLRTKLKGFDLSREVQLSK